jgi:hypothetical protein
MGVSRDWIGLIAAAALLLPFGAMAQTSPAETEQRTVVTEKSAYLALPPELVAEPVVTDLTVSNGGRFALAQRMKLAMRPEMLQQMLQQTDLSLAHPQAEISLVLWDSRTHLRTTVWQADPEEMRIESVTWLPTAEVAFVQVYQTVPVHPEQPQGEKTTRPVLLRIAPANGRAEVIDLPATGRIDMVYLTPSPTVPLAVVQGARFDGGHITDSLHIIDESGRFQAHTDLPQNVNVSGVMWTKNDQPLIHIAQRSPNSKDMTMTWCAMDTKTGALTPLPKQPKTPQEMAELVAEPKPAAALPLRLKKTRSLVKEAETTQTTGLLWLESVTKSEKPRILLSSDSSGGQLMARGQMALIQSQGAVWATPLVRIDLAAYTALKLQADRMRTMNRAKQAALAVLMYAQDNDEIMPGAEGLISNLSPYAADPSILDGFNYTYPGGPIADIASPAETVIGTMNGANGQAVIYADGHVKWR